MENEEVKVTSKVLAVHNTSSLDSPSKYVADIRLYGVKKPTDHQLHRVFHRRTDGEESGEGKESIVNTCIEYFEGLAVEESNEKDATPTEHKSRHVGSVCISGSLPDPGNSQRLKEEAVKDIPMMVKVTNAGALDLDMDYLDSGPPDLDMDYLDEGALDEIFDAFIEAPDSRDGSTSSCQV